MFFAEKAAGAKFLECIRAVFAKMFFDTARRTQLNDLIPVPAAGILHRKSSLCKQGEQDNVGMKRPYSALGAATAVRRVRRGFALGEAGSPSG